MAAGGSRIVLYIRIIMVALLSVFFRIGSKCGFFLDLVVRGWSDAEISHH